MKFLFFNIGETKDKRQIIRDEDGVAKIIGYDFISGARKNGAKYVRIVSPVNEKINGDYTIDSYYKEINEN